MNTGHYINGQWITGTGETLVSVNPADGSPIWQGHCANRDEVAMASSAAHQALPAWSSLKPEERMAFLHAFSRKVSEKKDELTRLISLENGKPLWEAATEVSTVIGKIDLSIKAWQERCPTQHGTSSDADTVLRYKPQGVVAVLGPFNFPAHLSNGHIVPALLAGNTIIYKPSELTPAVAALIMHCWHDSGLPKGVLNCVQGAGKTGQLLLSTDLQGVFFTGSYTTGKRIHQQFSEKPEVILALEMGGNNPLIIDETVDCEAAVYQTLISSLISSGQRCTAARRVFIPRNSHGDRLQTMLVEAIRQIKVSDAREQPEPFMGPVISHQQALNLLRSQQDLQDLGGKSLLSMRLLKDNTGLLSPGLVDMSKAANIPDEEIFGPLIQLFRYDEFEQAINMANQTRYGLSASLFSNNHERYQLFYQTIRAGLINWNRPTTGAASHLPFGGVGRSGNHRPSAFFAADYCAYPVASLEKTSLLKPENLMPGMAAGVHHASA